MNEAGISAAELAARSGLTEGAISYLRSGRREPSFRSIQALNAALPLVPPLPPADPLAPGPFAFADADRVRSILHDAGFATVTIDRIDMLIGSGDIEQTLALAFKVGPLGALLRENPHQKGHVADAVREALSHYATPAGVLMPAAVWVVLAHKGNG